jgi:hypothetical protein
MQPWYSEDAWLAVKTGNLIRLLTTLGLTDATDLTWRRWSTVRRNARKKFHNEEAAAAANRLR